MKEKINYKELVRTMTSYIGRVTYTDLKGLTPQQVNSLMLDSAEVLLRNSGARKVLKGFCSKRYGGDEFEQWRQTLKCVPKDEHEERISFYFYLLRFVCSVSGSETFDLSLPPLCLKSGICSVTNTWLIAYLRESEHMMSATYLTAELTSSDEVINWPKELFYWHQIIKVRSDLLHMACLGNPELLAQQYPVQLDLLLGIANHVCLSRRLGLDTVGLWIYDILDGMMSREFDYRLVDIVLELRKWMKQKQRRKFVVRTSDQADEFIKKLALLYSKHSQMLCLPIFAWRDLMRMLGYEGNLLIPQKYITPEEY